MSTDLKELKKVLEVQSRQKLHKDIKYKFLPSLGLKDIIQGFRNPKNKDFIGVLHFKWKSDENGQYDYHSIWYDTEEDAIETIYNIKNSKIYDEKMLIESIMWNIQKLYMKPVEDKNILLN
jgi:hypothetical protein